MRRKTMKLTVFAASMLGVVGVGSMILIIGLMDIYVRVKYPEERGSSIVCYCKDFPTVMVVYGCFAIICQVMKF